MKVAILNDTEKKVVNVVKAEFVKDVIAPEGCITRTAESWMSPNVEYTIADGVREVVIIQPTPKTEQEIKEILETKAYVQQDKYLNPNKSALFWESQKHDLELLPKLSVYSEFMGELWLEYNTAIDALDETADFSEIAPATEYSFVELQTELLGVLKS